MYPDWWGHEEHLRTPTETFMESKIASVSISNDQRSYGKPTSHDPPAKIVSTPCIMFVNQILSVWWMK